MTITYEGATEQVRQIVHHHAVLRRGLERHAGTVCDAAASGVPFQRQLAALRGYLEEEVLPHAEAEEHTLYPAVAAQARGSELVGTLTAEHRALAYLAGRLQPSADARTAASVAEWIATLFAGHVAKENDLLLPALTGAGADLAALLAAMHEPSAARAASALSLAGSTVTCTPPASSRRRESHHVSGLGAFRRAARRHGGGRHRLAGRMAHRGVPRRPAATRYISGRGCRAAREGNDRSRDTASSWRPASGQGSGLMCRERLTTGSLAALRGRGVSGVTANPAILARAISDSDAYAAQIEDLKLVKD